MKMRILLAALLLIIAGLGSAVESVKITFPVRQLVSTGVKTNEPLSIGIDRATWTVPQDFFSTTIDLAKEDDGVARIVGIDEDNMIRNAPGLYTFTIENQDKVDYYLGMKINDSSVEVYPAESRSPGSILSSPPYSFSGASSGGKTRGIIIQATSNEYQVKMPDGLYSGQIVYQLTGGSGLESIDINNAGVKTSRDLRTVDHLWMRFGGIDYPAEVVSRGRGQEIQIKQMLFVLVDCNVSPGDFHNFRRRERDKHEDIILAGFYWSGDEFGKEPRFLCRDEEWSINPGNQISITAGSVAAGEMDRYLQAVGDMIKGQKILDIIGSNEIRYVKPAWLTKEARIPGLDQVRVVDVENWDSGIRYQ